MSPPTTEARTYAAFGAAVLIGGANFIAVSFSNQEMPPLFGAALRFALAAALFFVITLAAHVPIARGRAAAGAAVYGMLAFGAAYAFLYYALVGLAAGTAAVIVATVPLFTLAFAVALGQEKLTWRGMLGGVLAIAGIGALSVGEGSGSLGTAYVIAGILGSVASAAASVVAKALPDVHPLNMNGIGMATGAAMLAVGSVVLRESWALPSQTETIVALLWLVLLGSIGLFQLVLYVIKRWTASAAVYVVTGMPVVAAVLGALLLDQPITSPVVVGGALVLAAVYVGAISGHRAGIDDTAEHA